MSVALKFQARTLSSRIERILQSGHPSLFKLTNMQKSVFKSLYLAFPAYEGKFPEIDHKAEEMGLGKGK